MLACGGVLAAALTLGGCLYLEDINQRPAIEIVRLTPSAIERGSAVELRAQVNDPDSLAVTLSWRAFACAETIEQCDDVPFTEGSGVMFVALVPVATAGHRPVQHARISLEARDERGAVARPSQVLDLDIVNAAPRVVDLQQVGRGAVVGVPLELRAKRSDADDPVQAVTLSWQVFAPAGSVHPPLQQLPSSLPDVERQQLIPDVPGAWTIEVTARDPVGATHTMQRALVVTSDQPPCLATLAPAPGGTLLLDQARRLSVLVVSDDLDPFPISPSGGVTRFSWSLLAPSRGAVRQPLAGAVDNAVELDPAAFIPGEVLELRVEIADRVARTLPCADGAATCSIDGSSCYQRQTWRLEVR